MKRLIASLMMGGMMMAGMAQAETTIQFWTQEGEADGGFQFVKKLVDGFMAEHADRKSVV